MNNILQLKGQFHKRRNTQSFGPVNLPKDAKVSAKHVNELRKQLEGVKKYWESTPVIKGALVSAHYQRIVPKSNRLQFLLGERENIRMMQSEEQNLLMNFQLAII